MTHYENDNDVADDHATASTVASLICATSALESRQPQLGSQEKIYTADVMAAVAAAGNKESESMIDALSAAADVQKSWASAKWVSRMRFMCMNEW